MILYNNFQLSKLLLAMIFSLLLSMCTLPLTIEGLQIFNPQPLPQINQSENETSSKIVDNGSSMDCNVSLDFSNMGLQVIKQNFISSPYVKSLKLRSNAITELQPDTFSSLPNLKFLDLSDNKLAVEKFFSFCSVQSLETLIIDNNKEFLGEHLVKSKIFDTVESVILDVPCVYHNLFHLSLRNNNLKIIRGDLTNNLPKLTHIDLSENDLKETINEIFKNLPQTVSNVVIENAEISNLRGSNLENIKSLNLNHNNFETVSNHYGFEKTLCLKGMNLLESLSLSDCSVKRIEIDTFKEVGKLAYLDISYNNFKDITEGMFQYLPSLKVLNISGNIISAMPNVSNLGALSSLIMDEMKMKTEFFSFENLSEMPTLEVLSLGWNRLTTIPSTFLDKLPKLRELHLDGNQITSLPMWAHQGVLTKLHMSRNRILSIEDLSLDNATSLKVLDLKGNSIFKLKASALKSLPDDMILEILE